MHRRPFIPPLAGGFRDLAEQDFGAEPKPPIVGDVHRDLPPDLWPRVPRALPSSYGGPVDRSPVDRSTPPSYTGDAIYLSRSLQGRVFTITTTPTLLVDASYAWPYLVLNPTKTAGLSTSVTGFNGTVAAAGNSQTTPGSIGVSGFYSVHYHLNVTAVTGTWDIVAQSYDSISAQWMDTQTIFAGIAATGQYYASAGTFGLATDLAFRWNPTAAGSLTFSLAAVLKGGLGGSSAGLAQVAYLGGPGVTTDTGYPLLEGQKQGFIIGENVQLWAVAGTNINIRVFML